MIKRRTLLAMLATAPLVATRAQAGPSRISSNDGYAIGGYDPVGYFASGAPVPGVDAHMLMWRGAVWRFATQTNLSIFERNPIAHAPRYGGYCAYAMAHGFLKVSDPQAWRIYEGRLYLTASPSILTHWSDDIPANVARADECWPAAFMAG
ncbi:YHS domain-containing (seleno)protein [Loktanella agnita]|uniref:YHS domain-containing (seleno)protein n=1 Tax=Loktanella agnita TaxID=287097 RepID=UPI0039888B3C